MIWMIRIPIRPDFDTRKLQKYAKCWEIDLWGGQNHVLCYFFRNMWFKGPIFHQSWVKISYDCLENNSNDSNDKKVWFWHQEVAKICQMLGNWSLRGSKLRFMLFLLWNVWGRRFKKCGNWFIFYDQLLRYHGSSNENSKKMTYINYNL